MGERVLKNILFFVKGKEPPDLVVRKKIDYLLQILHSAFLLILIF